MKDKNSAFSDKLLVERFKNDPDDSKNKPDHHWLCLNVQMNEKSFQTNDEWNAITATKVNDEYVAMMT